MKSLSAASREGTVPPSLGGSGAEQGTARINKQGIGEKCCLLPGEGGVYVVDVVAGVVPVPAVGENQLDRVKVHPTTQFK